MNFSSHTFIEHTSASGNFYIQGDSLRLTNKDRDETYIECDDEAGVKLNYANTTRCETSSTGISVTGNGTFSGYVTANSDENLKENIKTISGALNTVLKLRGVEFDFIENGQHSIGFIAQEVEKVLPELVFGTDPKSVAYQNFVSLLVEAIKEQNDTIKNLEERIIKLESKM